MELTHQLSRLFGYLETTVDRLDQRPISGADAFVTSLELEKLNVDLDKGRGLVLELESRTQPETGSPKLWAGNFGQAGKKIPKQAPAQFRAQLKVLNDRATKVSQEIKRVLEAEAKEAQLDTDRAQRRSSASAVLSSENSFHRRLGSRDISQQSSGLGLDEKLSVERVSQEQLTDDILTMVRTMKANALNLSDKMAKDSVAVENAAGALDRSSRQLNKVGSRLAVYHSTTAIGWWFYLMSTVFLVVALLVGMTLIRLFPKW